MSIRLAAITVLVCLCWHPREVTADWQYTRFGMTPAQVRAAAKGTAVTTSSEEREDGHLADKTSIALLKAPYVTGRFNFTAYFYFKADRLTAVYLKLQDPELRHDVLGELERKHGKVFSRTDSSVMKLSTWHKNGNQIVYVDLLGKDVSLSYQPLNSAEGNGL